MGEKVFSGGDEWYSELSQASVQTPPLQLYVTLWVFTWSLLLAALLLYSDLHEYTADGENRPPSLSSSASVCLSVWRLFGIGCVCCAVWSVWRDCPHLQTVCLCVTSQPAGTVEWRVCLDVCEYVCTWARCFKFGISLLFHVDKSLLRLQYFTVSD